MKKRILIFSIALTTICITAFDFANSNQAEESVIQNSPAYFFYDVNSRFGTTISKEELHKAVSVMDILPSETNWASHPIQSLKVTILRDNSDASEIGKTLEFNKAQMRLLRSTEYSDNFRLYAKCNGRHANSVNHEAYDLNYFLTVTPEKEAEYNGGQKALMAYLVENSKEAIAHVKEDELKAGMLNFTVTKYGTISNIKLTSSSGYPDVDQTMIELLTNAPGKWNPAENSTGEKLDQKLVFSFGQIGC